MHTAARLSRSPRAVTRTSTPVEMFDSIDPTAAGRVCFGTPLDLSSRGCMAVDKIRPLGSHLRFIL